MYLAILKNGHKVRGDSEFIRMLQFNNRILYLLEDGDGVPPEGIIDITGLLNPYVFSSVSRCES